MRSQDILQIKALLALICFLLIVGIGSAKESSRDIQSTIKSEFVKVKIK